MAKDVSNKTISNSNTDDSTTSSISDQQKVPPLRIVLNTSGNQKSSTTAVAVTSNQQQQSDLVKQQSEKGNDVKTDNVVKSGGRVRIKLGTNKQVSSKSGAEVADDSQQQTKQTKQNSTISEKQDTNSQKEEINVNNYSHLRRITRRSQRSVQTVNNEDEESISSMTSIDENQNTSTNNSNSDNNNSQDTPQTATTTTSNNVVSTNSLSTTNSKSSSDSSSNNAGLTEPQRASKYKRRKGETSESQSSSDLHDGPFSYQNYKLPNQNSFELFSNIRKQVDKKMKNLSHVRPKTAHGFRDYMMNRGAYLLDGNKLGNGTNLFMSEEGGLHTAPIGKYHALTRHNRVLYSVPNRAKVPLGIPINSPLYNLFIEQEKERYKMRIQHIKEREKLTLAAEQEMIRVYNQASMAAADQLEPFSACTMLKHQEIYNYMDSDGATILSSEDARQEQGKQPDNSSGTTRTRHREQISPSRNNNNNNTNRCSSSNNNNNNTNTNNEESTQLETNTQESVQPKDNTTTTTTTTEASNSTKGNGFGEAQQCANNSETTASKSSASEKNVTKLENEINDEKVTSDKGQQQKSTKAASPIAPIKESSSPASLPEGDNESSKSLDEKGADNKNTDKHTSNEDSKNNNNKETKKFEEELKETKETVESKNEKKDELSEAEVLDEKEKTNKKDIDDVIMKPIEEIVKIESTDEEEKSKEESDKPKDNNSMGKSDDKDKSKENDDALSSEQIDASAKTKVENNEVIKDNNQQQPKSDIMDASMTTEIASEYNPTNDSKNEESSIVVVPMDQDGQQQSNEQQLEKKTSTEHVIHETSTNTPDGIVCLSDDDRRAYNKSIFVTQLQEIDDKWEKVRNEMLVRHRNEAESLHAVQKLEWEWKTKEIGACDVRTTLIIDNTLVPKLNVYSQDY